MRTVITYPLPFDSWHTFTAEVGRFIDTFKHYPPGVDYELWAMCCWGEPNDPLREMFYGTKCRFVPYYFNGRDCGCAQFAAKMLDSNSLLVVTTTRTYFHKAGWLKQITDAREKYGPGLYGLCANREGYPLHICCRCYGIDSDDLSAYPHSINSREEGHAFETGAGIPEGPAHVWMLNQGKVAKVVMWDGVYDEPDWFTPANRFRNGDQSNMLVWDKHTDVYRDSSPEEKRRIASLCDG